MTPVDCIFTINPGSTSTKVAFVGADGKILWQQNVTHEGETGRSMREILPMRAETVRKLLDTLKEGYTPRAVVGRGGLLRPLQSGTYRVSDKMIDDLFSPKTSKHPSNLGAPLAKEFAARWNVPAFLVDPVTVDDFRDVARISGVPGIARRCRSHALNIRSCAHLAAKEVGKPLADTRFVIAHMGGGISVVAVEGGLIVDANDALLGMGPFSPERAGALPLEPLIDRMATGEITADQLKTYLVKNSGLKGYLGTNSLPEVEARVEAGDAQADLILRAMIYQIGKEIGAYAAAEKGKIDAVVLTGGLAQSKRFIASLTEYVGWLGRVLVFPGEREMEAMAAGAYRVLNGGEQAKEY